jgi:tetratricopeptide (TPR) repeat protein
MDQGQTDGAIRALEQATRLPGPVSQSFYLLGQAHLQSGNHGQAKVNCQRAIELLPDHTQAFFALYRACLGLGQAEEAQKYRDEFLKLEAIDRRSHAERSSQEDALGGLPMVRTTVARTFFGAGQIYQVHQQPSKAVELFRKAATLDAESAVYRAALESFYLKRK